MKPSREEILRIAKDCGFLPYITRECGPSMLERFAAAMYEACAAECGKLLAEQDSEYNRKTNAMITRHSNQLATERAVSDKLLEALQAERAVSDKLLGALKRAANDLWANEATSCGRAADRVIAEVEAMRKEQE